MNTRLFKVAGIAFSILWAAQSPLFAGPPAPDSGVSVNIKGVTIDLGGFIEAAGIYRSTNSNSDIASKFQSLPLSNSPGYYQDQALFSARQSRLSLLAKADFDQETHLAGYYEMDFLGAAPTANSNECNSYNLRIRHLYTTIDWDNLGLHLLGGQTWSLATMNSEGIVPGKVLSPMTIDAQYVVGFTWTRQPGFRIVKDFDRMLWLGVSVENPQTTIASQPKAITAVNDANSQAAGSNFASTNTMSANSVPDFVGKVAFDPGWGHFEVYDLARNFQSNLVNSTKTSIGDTSIETNAAGAGILLPIVPKVLTLMASGLIGSGIGRYGSGQLSDAVQDQQGIDIPLNGSQLLTGLTFTPVPEATVYAYYGQEQINRQAWTGTNDSGYGYGVSIAPANNSGTATIGGTVNGNISKISEITVGTWLKCYEGKAGEIRLGLQYAHAEDLYYSVADGGTPAAYQNQFYVSLRYYWK